MEMIKEYSKFLFISMCMGLVIVCLSACIMTYTNVSDNMMSILVYTSVAISVFAGSTMLGKKVKQKGYIYGALFGLIFFSIIYIFTVVSFKGFFVNWTATIYLFTSLISGAVGGILGVNILGK